jgi:uncharacterized low-complexity protein
MNVTKTSVSLALTAVLGSSGLAIAGDNPFGMQVLDQGYQVAEADTKVKDGKCGEGKCGGKTDAKAKDGKCGEGKCGGKTDAKAKDGKCGEGKCGGAKKDMPAEGTPQ